MEHKITLITGDGTGACVDAGTCASSYACIADQCEAQCSSNPDCNDDDVCISDQAIREYDKSKTKCNLANCQCNLAASSHQCKTECDPAGNLHLEGECAADCISVPDSDDYCGTCTPTFPGDCNCIPPWVDADKNPANGCECKPTSPSTEVCDGIDNDCNGIADDGLDYQITCGYGSCQRSVQYCKNGIETPCVPLASSCSFAYKVCTGTYYFDTNCQQYCPGTSTLPPPYSGFPPYCQPGSDDDEGSCGGPQDSDNDCIPNIFDVGSGDLCGGPGDANKNCIPDVWEVEPPDDPCALNPFIPGCPLYCMVNRGDPACGGGDGGDDRGG